MLASAGAVWQSWHSLYSIQIFLVSGSAQWHIQIEIVHFNPSCRVLVMIRNCSLHDVTTRSQVVDHSCYLLYILWCLFQTRHLMAIMDRPGSFKYLKHVARDHTDVVAGGNTCAMEPLTQYISFSFLSWTGFFATFWAFANRVNVASASLRRF